MIGRADGHVGTRAARTMAVLQQLGRAAAEGRGWCWGGVDGWLLYEDVAAAVPAPVAEVLPSLAQRGLAQRVDVRPPGGRRSVWMYRVTAAGLRALDQDIRRALPVLAQPTRDEQAEETFILPRRTWAALAVLQSSALRSGWMNLRQLAAAGARLDSEDARWLVRMGLVERRRALAGSQSWHFRVSALGRRLRSAPRQSPSHVQVLFATGPMSADA